MVENRWVSSESSFIDMRQWDLCVDPGLSAAPANDAVAAVDR